MLRKKIRSILRAKLPLPVFNFIEDSWVSEKQKIRSRGLRSLHKLAEHGYYPKVLYPKCVSIFLTTRCNLRCFFCRDTDFKGKDLKFENILRLERAIRNAAVVDLTGWGECVTYPKFREVVDYISSLNPKPVVRITSNGALLTAELGRLLAGRISQLVFSLNAATAETYERDMVFGKFARTLQHLEKFLCALTPGDRKKTVFHFVAHAKNFHEVPEFVRLAHKFGVPSVTVGQYLIRTTEHMDYTLLTVRESYSRVIHEADQLARELGVELAARRFGTETAVSNSRCMEPFDSVFIGTEGEVWPCCYAGSQIMGNVYNDGFEAVWFGERYRQLRRKRFFPQCQNCTLFVPLDDPAAHYTAHVKETAEFQQLHPVLT